MNARVHSVSFPLICAVLLLAGCATKTVVIQHAPEVTALTPAKDRLSDPVLKADLAFLDGLNARAVKLPEASLARIEATVWIEAARDEYLRGSWQPWVDQAAQNARNLLIAADPAKPSPADETGVSAQRRVLDAWIAHVRATCGFRSALPLITRAETLSAATTPTTPDVRPRDLTDRLYAVQTRLAALHDEAKISVLDRGWAKAQAWLDFAIAEHHIRDHSGVVHQASDEAQKLVELLEAAHDREPGAKLIHDGKPTTVGYKDEPKPVALTKPEDIAAALAAAVAETPRLGDSADAPKDFRADLWSVADHAPAGALRSQLEIALIHAAHERAQGGRPSSRPYEVAAERLAAQLSPATP